MYPRELHSPRYGRLLGPSDDRLQPLKSVHRGSEKVALVPRGRLLGSLVLAFWWVVDLLFSSVVLKYYCALHSRLCLPAPLEALGNVLNGPLSLFVST